MRRRSGGANGEDGGCQRGGERMTRGKKGGVAVPVSLSGGRGKRMGRRQGTGEQPLMLLLLLIALVTSAPSSLCFPSAIRQRAREIHKAWEGIYGLADLRHPPESVKVPAVKRAVGGGEAEGPAVPWAPHLEECKAVTAHRRSMEGRATAEAYPHWACAKKERGGVPGEEEGGGGESGKAGGGSVSFCGSPKPPWILGADEDNLPLTRVAQRDIWAHQFPPNCSSAGRFLLVGWKSHMGHGLGAQLHIMSVALSLALQSSRILVPLPGSFHRADHPGCTGAKSSLDCYFFPLTSPQCTHRAMALKHLQGATPERLRHKSPQVLANSSLPIVLIKSSYVWTAFKLEAGAAERWGHPWAHQGAPFELLGSAVPTYDRKMAQVNWWRSQSVRFMLRWPSAYLCHLSNRARHEAYGLRVALRVAAAEAARHSIEESREGFMKRSEAALLTRGNSKRTIPLEQTPLWRFPAEPYVLRPIISMHVRQGDKAKEMKLFSLPSFMWLANRVRLHVPDAHYVWLSSEMQTVIDDAERYPDWTFFYTRVKRQTGTTAFNAYEKDAGLEQIVGTSFVNLIISSQCDYFVGTLGSNWNRLINELRLTNGRLRASYMTLNNNDW